MINYAWEEVGRGKREVSRMVSQRGTLLDLPSTFQEFSGYRTWGHWLILTGSRTSLSSYVMRVTTVLTPKDC